MEQLFVDREQWIVVESETILSSTFKEGWEKLNRKAQMTIWIFF